MEAAGQRGFLIKPRPVRTADYGVPLPTLAQAELRNSTEGLRQLVLLATLAKLEEESASARYYKLALANLQRWAQATTIDQPEGGGERPACSVHVLPGDWGEVTLAMTQRYGKIFASLNMANAHYPGGGYAHGMVAQEENMFRRTDCHFALDRADMEEDSDNGLYSKASTRLLNAEDGRVYLDTQRPRVCVRGPEDRSVEDLGYRWLGDDEVLPFYELRAAAVCLMGGAPFSREETAWRVRAQLETLAGAGVRHVVLSAFGCGAFRNPAEQVAAVYREELQKRAADFDVVAFGIFHAGYGPNNFAPFEAAFAGWATP